MNTMYSQTWYWTISITFFRTTSSSVRSFLPLSLFITYSSTPKNGLFPFDYNLVVVFPFSRSETRCETPFENQCFARKHCLKPLTICRIEFLIYRKQHLKKYFFNKKQIEISVWNLITDQWSACQNWSVNHCEISKNWGFWMKLCQNCAVSLVSKFLETFRWKHYLVACAQNRHLDCSSLLNSI